MRKVLASLFVSAAVCALNILPNQSARVAASGPAAAERPGASARFVPNEILIQFADGASEGQKADARARIGATQKEHIRTEPFASAGQPSRGDLELANVPPGLAIADAARSLSAHPAVRFAEPNWIYTHQATATDTYYTNGSLWGLYGDSTSPANQFGSQAGEAWARGNTGSASVFVGVIDEGIQYDHPDLNGQIWTNPFDPADGVDNDGNGYVDDIRGWDFDGNNNTIYDGGTSGSGSTDDHGTHVSGTIGGRANNNNIVGVAWNVTIISGKFLGKRGGTTANAIRAVDYFTDLKTRHGLNIVATNNSWGGGGFSQALMDAISRANAANILFIAAAGNEGRNNDTLASYPGNYNVANVISVAAIDSAGRLASFSNYGATQVDIGAPGVGIWSSTAYNMLSSMGGTSMAAPHVTGGAVLYAASHPGATAAQIKLAILSTAVPTPSLVGKCTTGGRLDVSSF
jgi:subtilisin family serine protease